MIKILGLGPLG